MREDYYKYSVLAVCGELAGFAKGTLHESAHADIDLKAEWLRMRIRSFVMPSHADLGSSFDQTVLGVMVAAIELYEEKAVAHAKKDQRV